MPQTLAELCRFFDLAAEQQEPLVLASVVHTEGSTYRKAGARALISADGRSSGMLSGGCLEADLRERATRVLQRARGEYVRFDTRESDDPLWGLGLGCEGTTEIWLQPELPHAAYPVMRYLQHCWRTHSTGLVSTVVGGEAQPEELGRHGLHGVAAADALSQLLSACTAPRAEMQTLRFEGRELRVFVAPVALPPSLLICGAGLDAIPVARYAVDLGWRVTVYDHRAAYADARHFPGVARVFCARPEELPRQLDPAGFNAAVVMSHHLPADIAYLKCLTQAPPTYIGVLGPAARRQRLQAELGALTPDVAARIHGPAGLDIGAGSPASIALSIIAQIHAVLAGKDGGPFDAPR